MPSFFRRLTRFEDHCTESYLLIIQDLVPGSLEERGQLLTGAMRDICVRDGSVCAVLHTGAYGASAPRACAARTEVIPGKIWLTKRFQDASHDGGT